ncbi:MAG: MOSC domain-containing protein [Rhodospirillales bacterium]
MAITLRDICRYPVKGLSPEHLEAVSLRPGEALPYDRRYALALGSTPVSGAISEWMPKSSFLCLMRNQKLAQLRTGFDDTNQTLTVHRGGNQVARGQLKQKIGRTMIEDFFAAFMKDEARGRPKLVEAADNHVLSDHDSPVVSIINLGSVKDLERIVGTALDPQRFRGNFMVDGLQPWAEFDLCGKQIAAGDALLEVLMPIDRCAATNVNPETAERDLNIPKNMQRGLGHIDCGVFARVVQAGDVKVGDEFKVI